jgi:hypothetical protein
MNIAKATISAEITKIVPSGSSGTAFIGDRIQSSVAVDVIAG